jgi:hypothetical protein
MARIYGELHLACLGGLLGGLHGFMCFGAAWSKNFTRKVLNSQIFRSANDPIGLFQSSGSFLAGKHAPKMTG